MSTNTTRTVRWFGTRVPLISRGVLSIVTLIVALPLSVVLILYFGYSILSTNWLISLLLMLLVGTISHFSFLLFLRFRYKNPPTNTAFLDLIGRILQKILVPSRAQVWVRQSNDAFITSTYNAIFDVVIVSEPMVDLILKRPEAGEVLLAFHLVRIPRTRWIGDYVGSLILFVILTFISNIILTPLFNSMIYFLPMGGLIIFYLASNLTPYIMISLLFVLMTKGSFWRHEPAFMRIMEAYGMHPQVAKLEVERESPLDEEEMQSVIWGVREWEKKRRSARRLGVSTIVTIPIGFILFFVSAGLLYIPYYNILLIYAPFVVAILIGVVIYYIIKRWDKNAMGEVFQETTDSHEPIWMD